MNFFRGSCWLILGLALWTGCEKQPPVASPPASIEDILPKQAQPKLRTMKLYLGAETLDAELAISQKEMMTGMMYRSNLTEQDAMIFPFSAPQRAAFWMKNCPESLSAAYINPDGVIQEIHHLEKNDTNSVIAGTDTIQYVLEVKDGWFARHNIATGAVVRTERGSLAETFQRRQQ